MRLLYVCGLYSFGCIELYPYGLCLVLMPQRAVNFSLSLCLLHPGTQSSGNNRYINKISHSKSPRPPRCTPPVPDPRLLEWTVPKTCKPEGRVCLAYSTTKDVRLTYLALARATLVHHKARHPARWPLRPGAPRPPSQSRRGARAQGFRDPRVNVNTQIPH